MSIKIHESKINIDDLSGFGGIEATKVDLAKIPIEAQPNKYIKNAYSPKDYGTIKAVDVKLASDGGRLFVNLSFADSETPNSEFQDSVAVFFPGLNGASETPVTIGSLDAPVLLWQWKNRTELQKNLSQSKDLESFGPGVFIPNANPSSIKVEANGELTGGIWNVVISGDLAAVEKSKKIGIAAWDGSNNERAGIGSVCTQWIDID